MAKKPRVAQTFRESRDARNVCQVKVYIRPKKCNSVVKSYCTKAKPRLSRQERDQAIGRLNAGQSTQTVARASNVHVTTIRHIWTRFNAFQTTNDRRRSGRPRVTSVGQDHLIYFQHRQERTRSASETTRVTIGNH